MDSKVGFDAVLPVINQLQDIFSVTGGSVSSSVSSASSSGLVLLLPQIAVIGSQSSGKSSVLESVVGRDFLPRGSGIVTRRPLILQLVNTRATDNEAEDGDSKDRDDVNGEEWGEFLHLPGKKFTDFREIRREIERETDRLTGTNKGISREPINLKVCSPNVVDLTLVDLPGVTRVPVGDQPDDIEQQIRDMVMEFISQPNTIILAVTAANTDLANSDALRLAKDVDPRGHRTIGVLTKLDLMDQGTNCMDALEGRVVPLDLGYVPVVNRSQKDINDRKDIRAALDDEAQFFAEHPVYSKLRGRSGVPYLAATLNRLLLEHVRAFLPDLRTKIGAMLSDAEHELAECGAAAFGGASDAQLRSVMLLDVITKCANKFREAVWGDEPGAGASGNLVAGRPTASGTSLAVADAQQRRAAKELGTGARINYIFNDVFGAHVQGLEPLSGVSDNDIKTTLHNAAGTKPALFIAEAAFELLIRRQISLLRLPALQCVDLVHDELREAATNLDLPELARFDRLREAISEELRGHLAQHSERAKTMITHLLDCELAFININHPDFAGADEVTSRMLKESMKVKAAKASADNSNDPNDHSSSSSSSPTTKDSESAKKPSTSWWNRGGSKSSVTSPSSSSSANGSEFSGRQSSRNGKGTGSKGQQDRLRKVPTQIIARNYRTSKEVFEIDVIRTLMISYFDIVRLKVFDFVPKSIMHFLVQESQKEVQTKLIHALYNDAKMNELLEESPLIVAKRKDCLQLIEVLRKAKNVLSKNGYCVYWTT